MSIITRDELYNRKHGVLGWPIKGLNGSVGEPGSGIRIGFINDFFDHTDISISTVVKMGKRKPKTSGDYYNYTYNNINESKLEYDKTTLSNEQFLLVLNDSSNSIYYTGRISLDSLLYDYHIDEMYGNNQKSNGVYIIDQEHPSTFDTINTTLRNDNHNIESWQFHEIYDITYNNKDYLDLYEYKTDGAILTSHLKYDVKVSYNTVPYEPEDIVIMMDGYYYKNNIYNNPIQPSKYFAYLDIDSNNKIVYSNNGVDYANLLYDKNYYTDIYAQGVHTHIGVLDNGHIKQYSYDNLPGNTSNNMYIPYEVTTENNLDDIRKYVHVTADAIPAYISEPIIDDNGFMLIGIDLYDPSIWNTSIIEQSNSLYKIMKFNLFKVLREKNEKSNNTGILKGYVRTEENTLRKLSDKLEVNINKMRFSHNTDSSVRWYVDPFKNIKIPTTLSKDIIPGDILYFYTDEKKYALNHEIPYMILITSELLNCDVDTLLKHTVIKNPLQYKSLYINNDSKNILLLNKVNIIKNTADDSNRQQNNNMRALGNILSNKNDSIVELASILETGPNVKSDYNFVNLISYEIDNKITKVNNDITELSITAKTVNQNISSSTDNPLSLDSIEYRINSHNKPIQFSNLYMNENSYSNVIPASLLEDDIKFSNDSFNSMCVNPLELTDIITQTITSNNVKYDIIKINFNKKKFITANYNDYIIGYYIIDNNYEIIQDGEFSDNEKLITLSKIKTTLDEDISSDDCIYNILVYVRHNNKFKHFSPTHHLTYTLVKNSINNTNITNLQLLVSENDVYIPESTKQNTDDIAFNITGITCEENNNKILDIISSNDKLVIDAIYFNNTKVNTTYDEIYGLYNNNVSIGNVWFNVSFNKENLHAYHLKMNEYDTTNKLSQYQYNISIKDNIPNITEYTSLRNIYTRTINDYMITLNDDLSAQKSLYKEYKELVYGNVSDNSIVECDLFNLLWNKHILPITSDRNINVNILYHYVDILKDNNIEIINTDVQYPLLSAQYSITQPGFKDPRTLPKFNLKLYNTPKELEIINTKLFNNNVNQFSTLLKVTVDDFDYSNWGRYIKNKDDVKISFTIKNLNYDIEWKQRLLLDNALKRSTIKVLLDDNTHVREINYFKFNVSNVIHSPRDKDNNIENLNDNAVYDINKNNKSTITFKSLTNNAGTYIYLNPNNIYYFKGNIIESFKQPKNIYGGISADILLDFNDYTIDDLKNGIYTKFDYEIGNPLISNLYLRFYVDSFKITYKVDDKEYTFTSKVDPNIDTYLHTQEGLKDNYRFLSNKLDAMINPISYIVCPEDEETSIPMISGNVKKVSSPELIKRKLELYNKDAYNSDLISIPIVEQLLYQLFSWDGLLLRKSSFQDNILNITVSNKALSVNDNLLWLVYNNNIMNPKHRNNLETFYYNDMEYDAQRYNQYNLNGAISVKATTSWQIRSDYMMDAIDTWNFEYLNNGNKDNINHVFDGIMNKYANGYMYLPDNIDIKLYNNKMMSLRETKEDGNILLHTLKDVKNLSFDDPINNNLPLSNGYFRSFLWDIGWYYESNKTINSTNEFCHIVNSAESNIDIVSFDNDEVYTKYINMISNINYRDYSYYFDLLPRIAYNAQTDSINVLMLRKPTIGKDKDDMNDMEVGRYLKKRYFNVSEDTDFHKSFSSSDDDNIHPNLM